MKSALGSFFIELCAAERAQDASVSTAVTVGDDGTVVVATCRGDAHLPVTASRMDIQRGLVSVSGHGDEACIDLTTAMERRRFPVDLRTILAASAVIEACGLDLHRSEKDVM